MARSSRSSNASVACRLEWRPSRWQAWLLAPITFAACFSLLVCALPAVAAWPAALAAAGWGMCSLRRELRRPPRQLLFPGDDTPVRIDGEAVEDVQVHWRGPLAFMRWRDRQGRVQRLAWWPDTLPPPRRRELRLAAGPAGVSPRRAGMAP